jgi:hypothetical protein
MKSSIERTITGMQYVIPGAEQIVKPRRRAFNADGDQFVIPGAERISTREYLARLAESQLHRAEVRSGCVG